MLRRDVVGDEPESPVRARRRKASSASARSGRARSRLPPGARARGRRRRRSLTVPTTLYGPFARTVIVTSLTQPSVAVPYNRGPCRFGSCLVTASTRGRCRTTPNEARRGRSAESAARATRGHRGRRARAVLPVGRGFSPVAAALPERRARRLVVAVSRAVPVTPRSAVGIPVGVRANVAAALRRGAFDVVHGFDPAFPGWRTIALLEAQTTTAATFVDPERLGFPPGRTSATGCSPGSTACWRRATTSPRRAAARFPGAYTVVPAGVDLGRFAPRPEGEGAS